MRGLHKKLLQLLEQVESGLESMINKLKGLSNMPVPGYHWLSLRCGKLIILPMVVVLRTVLISVPMAKSGTILVVK